MKLSRIHTLLKLKQTKLYLIKSFIYVFIYVRLNKKLSKICCQMMSCGLGLVTWHYYYILLIIYRSANKRTRKCFLIALHQSHQRGIPESDQQHLDCFHHEGEASGPRFSDFRTQFCFLTRLLRECQSYLHG